MFHWDPHLLSVNAHQVFYGALRFPFPKAARRVIFVDFKSSLIFGSNESSFSGENNRESLSCLTKGAPPWIAPAGRTEARNSGESGPRINVKF